MNGVGVQVRREQPGDVNAIRMVNEAAFGRPDEADLVDRLRGAGTVLGSFVAEQQSSIVGHILFTRTIIDAGAEPVPSVALAPLAVLPMHQSLGIGSEMVRFGLDWLRTRGERSVLVLGHPHYYSRFGFSTGRAASLVTPFPRDAFMALELVAGALDGIRGSVRYPAAFGL